MNGTKSPILGWHIQKDTVVGKCNLNIRYKNTPVWFGLDICVKTHRVVGKCKLNIRYKNTPSWLGLDICVKTY